MSNTVTVLTAREALNLALGKGKVSLAQFSKAAAGINAGQFVEALGAYGVATRGVVSFADGASSLTELAKRTKRDGQEVEARRTALSKLTKVVGSMVKADVPMTVEAFEPIRLAHDSTAEGREMLAKALKAYAAEQHDKAGALADLLTACEAAKATKAAKRKASDAAKAEAAAKAAAESKASEANAEATTVVLTWGQRLAVLASQAKAEAPALDAAALTLALNLATSIVEELTDAKADVEAKVSTARATRKGK